MILYYSGADSGGPNETRCLEVLLALSLMPSYDSIHRGDRRLLRRLLRVGRAVRERDRSGVCGSQFQFLDSGSFSLKRMASTYSKETGKSRWAYYHTKDHRNYLDGYAAFVKKYQPGIDHYANVDVIGNPDLTWRNQKYLEHTHGLSPVPVFHYKTDLQWLRRYMEGGYSLIGLGGLVGGDRNGVKRWLDQVFSAVCGSSGLPLVKLHGFGVTSFYLMQHYPWWSVDSATWAKVGGFGGVLIPHKRDGVYVFNTSPYVMKTSIVSVSKVGYGSHFLRMSDLGNTLVADWLRRINVPIGKNDPDGAVTEYGVINRHCERKLANLLFFESFRKSLPDWPWPFERKVRNGRLLDL